jgi:hypothetical protein
MRANPFRDAAPFVGRYERTRKKLERFEMVTKKRGLVVKVEQPSFPADPFKVKLNSLLLSISNRKKDHEAEWGISRLIELVDSELRTKFWNQMERVWLAQENRDEERLEKSVKGMIAGYDALEGYAVKNGISRMPDIAAIEHEMADGSVMVVVKTKDDALLYSQFRPEVQGRHIWNMEEIETMMAGAVMREVIKIKQLDAGATMVKVGGDSGFDDMDSDLDFSKPSTLPKKFNTELAEAGRNASI